MMVTTMSEVMETLTNGGDSLHEELANEDDVISTSSDVTDSQPIRRQNLADVIDDEPQASSSESALFNAVANLDYKAIEDLLKEGVDVNFTCSEYKYRSVLHELVLSYISNMNFERHGKFNIKFIDILTLLVNHGLEVNAFDVSRETALHKLANHPGFGDQMRILLASGVKANHQDICHQTALHKAVIKGTALDVETLIDGGGNPECLDHGGYSPLHLACKRKHHSDVLSVLLGSGANPNCRQEGDGIPGTTPLHMAVKSGDVVNVKMLLAGGADVDLADGSGQTAIHLAAANDLTGKILDTLIRHGASVNERDYVFRETPLHKAVKNDMIENFKILVKNQVNPNLQDDLLETPLHRAASCTKPFIWVNLMNLGGDATVKNKLGLTPLDKAMKSKNNMAASIMKEYLDRGSSA